MLQGVLLTAGWLPLLESLGISTIRFSAPFLLLHHCSAPPAHRVAMLLLRDSTLWPGHTVIPLPKESFKVSLPKQHWWYSSCLLPWLCHFCIDSGSLPVHCTKRCVRWWGTQSHFRLDSSLGPYSEQLRSGPSSTLLLSSLDYFRPCFFKLLLHQLF